MKFYGYNKSNWLGTEILLVDFSVSKSLESEWWKKTFKEKNFYAILNSLVRWRRHWCISTSQSTPVLDSFEMENSSKIKFYCMFLKREKIKFLMCYIKSQHTLFERINCCCGYYPRCGPRSFLLLFKFEITWKEKLKKKNELGWSR